MALLGYDARTLCRARRRGVRFDSTLTIGRLNLYLHPRELTALRRYHCAPSSATGGQVLAGYRFGDHADQFLRECLGAKSHIILDNSAYEGATCLHDLNRPLPDDLLGRFDVVIEAGSLEHVFNFPAAVANLMNALKIGGTLFATVPANNLCGHGFYQFSPELMFRVFSRENGFELSSVSLVEARFPAVESTPVRTVYRVSDPAEVGRRVGLRTSRPVMMAIEATKRAQVALFAPAPQQSDYVARWSAASREMSGMGALVTKLPQPVRARIIGYYHIWEYSFRNRTAYRRDTAS